MPRLSFPGELHDPVVGEGRALRETVKSQRQLAREFGVSQATISVAVGSKGRHKQPSPERRAATLAAR